MADADLVFYAEHLKSSKRPEMIRPHYHDYYEAYMFLGDEMTYFIDNHSYKLQKYDIVYIDKSTYHRTFYHDKCTRERILVAYDDSLYSLTGDPDFSDKVKMLYEIKKPDLPESVRKDLFLRYFSHIAAAFTDDDALLGSMKSRLLFISLLIESVNLSKKYMNTSDPKKTLSTPQKLVMNAVDYINKNYNQRISLDDISAACYVSKYYLCHIFRDITGVSINSFLKSKRMNEAEKLLKYTHESISGISEQTGFSNANAFIGSFKKRYGTTPGKYRQNILKSH